MAKIGFKNRMYYFCRNLLGMIIGICFLPFFLISSIALFVWNLTITDGSTTTSFPWEWDWAWWDNHLE